MDRTNKTSKGNPDKSIDYSQKALLDVIRQTQRKRKNRQRGIESSASREYRAAGQIQVLNPVNAAIFVNDTLFRIPMHARRSHVMLIPTQIAGPFVISFGNCRLKLAKPSPVRFFRQQPVAGDHTASVL